MARFNMADLLDEISPRIQAGTPLRQAVGDGLVNLGILTSTRDRANLTRFLRDAPGPFDGTRMAGDADLSAFIDREIAPAVADLYNLDQRAAVDRSSPDRTPYGELQPVRRPRATVYSLHRETLASEDSGGEMAIELANIGAWKDAWLWVDTGQGTAAFLYDVRVDEDHIKLGVTGIEDPDFDPHWPCALGDIEQFCNPLLTGLFIGDIENKLSCVIHTRESGLDREIGLYIDAIDIRKAMKRQRVR